MNKVINKINEASGFINTKLKYPIINSTKLINIIKKFVKNKIFTGENYPEKDEDIIKCLIQKHNIVDNPPKTLEQLFYRIIFEKYFPNKGNTIPYFWMPKFTNAQDASARSLDIYSVRNN